MKREMQHCTIAVLSCDIVQTQYILMVPDEFARGIAVIYDREADGRVVTEVPALPGVMAYGAN